MKYAHTLLLRHYLLTLFVGYFLVTLFKTGHTPPGTRDLVLLRLVMYVRFRCCSCCCPCCSGWFQNKDNFLGPFPSSIVVVFVVLRSRPRPRSKNQPGPVVLCCTHHTLQLRHTAMAGFIEVHRRRRRPSQHQQQLSAPVVRGVFLFPRPMKIGTIFVSSPQVTSPSSWLLS